MKWLLKPITGITVAPNASTDTAESTLQTESSIDGPGRPGKMQVYVFWDEVGVGLA